MKNFSSRIKAWSSAWSLNFDELFSILITPLYPPDLLSRRSSVVEQPIRNRQVGSSTLPVGSNKIKELTYMMANSFFFFANL